MLRKNGENKLHIGIDLDETLCYTVREVIKSEISGIILDEKDISNYYLHKIPGVNLSAEEAVELFRNVYRNDFNKLELMPINGASNKLQSFIDKGYKNTIVTARDIMLFENYTNNWVNKHYNNLISKILFANHFGKAEIPKSVLCKQYGINKMVEDNIDFSMELVRNGIPTYILHKPWNYNRKDKHELLKRVEDWSEIEI